MKSEHKIAIFLPILFLVSLTLAGFFPGLNGGFISDDWPQVAENPYFESIGALPGFFTKGVWGNSGMDDGLQTLYRPVFLLWNFTIFSIWGANPFSFHAALLVLHCLNVVLLFLISGRLFPGSSRSGKTLAVLIFALHPAQTHCISWISGGTDVILAFFIFLSFHNYLGFKNDGSGRSLFFSYLFFSLALLTKETAAVYPLLLLAFDWQNKREKRVTNSVAAGFFLLLLVYLLIRGAALDKGVLQFSMERGLRIFDFFSAAVWYMIAPLDLPFYFRYPHEGIASGLMLMTGGLALPVMAYILLRHQAYSLPVIWFLLFLLPPLGAAFNENGVFAIRFLYLPTAGFSLAIAIFLGEKSPSAKTMMGIICITTSLLITITWSEIKVWKSGEVFFSRVLSLNPTASAGYNGLAEHYARYKRFDDAIEILKRGALEIREMDQRVLPLEKLALLYADMGQNHNSIKTYEELVNTSRKEVALVGLGNNYWVLKNFDKALMFYKKAMKVNNNSFFAVYNYAKLNEQLGRNSEAKLFYRKLLLIPAEKEGQLAATMDARKFLSSRF